MRANREVMTRSPGRLPTRAPAQKAGPLEVELHLEGAGQVPVESDAFGASGGVRPALGGPQEVIDGCFGARLRIDALDDDGTIERMSTINRR